MGALGNTGPCVMSFVDLCLSDEWEERRGASASREREERERERRERREERRERKRGRAHISGCLFGGCLLLRDFRGGLLLGSQEGRCGGGIVIVIVVVHGWGLGRARVEERKRECVVCVCVTLAGL
jgi:hypothetical protein